MSLRELVISIILGGIFFKYVYRIWFHPLAKYQGPLLGRLSNIWTMYHMAKFTRAHAIQQAHEQYGDVIRIAPNELSVSDSRALKAIYGHQTGLPKTDFYSGGHFTQHHNLFSVQDKHSHSGRRSMLAKPFSQGSLMTLMPKVQEKLDILFGHFSRLSEGGTGKVDIYHWIHLFALDVIFEIVIGVSSGTLVNGEEHPTIKELDSFISAFAWMAVCPPLRYYGTEIPIEAIRRPFDRLCGWIQSTLEMVTAARSQPRSSRTPAMDHLLEDTDGALERKLTDLEIVEEIISFFFAGSGTTSNTIIFLIWSVLKDNNIYKKLQAELRTAFPNGKKPDIVTIQGLPYINAVIMETLRKYPTIPGTQPRYTLNEDVTILGEKVPRGITIGVQNYSVHRNPRDFPDPEHFIPERWLGADDEQIQAFNGFGLGPRACIGRNLAFIELRSLVAGFFHRFDASIEARFPDSEMVLIDGFAGRPRGERLPLVLQDHWAKAI